MQAWLARPVELVRVAPFQQLQTFSPGAVNMEESTIAIRHVATVSWQVLLDGDQWHSCRKGQDARCIAHHVLIAQGVLSGERTGKEVARSSFD